MALITAAQLRSFAPRCDAIGIAPLLDQAFAEAAIDTSREIRHAMAHMHHESQGFTVWKENLNWKTPERLDAFFASVKGKVDAANLIARGPRAIANRVYAGKGGNGDERSGDGWKYRGRTPIQLTLRSNYVAASEWTGLDLVGNPDLADDPAIACRIAAQWWRRNGLGDIVAVDDGEIAIDAIEERIRANELDDCLQATRRINGGTNGRDDRIAQLLRAGKIWN